MYKQFEKVSFDLLFLIIQSKSKVKKTKFRRMQVWIVLVFSF